MMVLRAFSLALLLIVPVHCAGGKNMRVKRSSARFTPVQRAEGGNCDSAADKDACRILKNWTAADKNHELTFDHLCSDLDRHDGIFKSAYGFFESAGGAPKALILADISVGWSGFHLGPEPLTSRSDSEDIKPEAKGIVLELEKAQIQSLSEWAGRPFSLALQTENTKTNQTARGAFSKTFFYSFKGSGRPADKKYEISQTGDFVWERLKEPEEEETGPGPSGEYKGSEGIYISSAKVNQPEDPHRLYLVLKNEVSGKVIMLQGPVVNNLKSLWDIKYSGPRVLTWGMFNPWQEGSLFDWAGDAFRYGDCIYLRKAAKKEFERRWKKQ